MRDFDDLFDDHFDRLGKTVNWGVRIAVLIVALVAVAVIVVGILVLNHFNIL